MIQYTRECWHKAVYFLQTLTCFLQESNSRVSNGRDYMHLTSCWYLWHVHVHMKLAWLSVLCHRPYPQLCKFLQSLLSVRPISTSFLQSLILPPLLVLVPLLMWVNRSSTLGFLTHKLFAIPRKSSPQGEFPDDFHFWKACLSWIHSDNSVLS